MGFRPKEIDFKIEGDPYTLRIDHLHWDKQHSILPTYKTVYRLFNKNNRGKRLKVSYPYSFRYCIKAVIDQALDGIRRLFR